MLKKTPLSEAHARLNAKMVGFSGWYMPVQYTNVIDEHITTRTKVGIFDTSHMGELVVSGKNSFDFLQKIVTKDITKLERGKAFYTAMCYENGCCVDDLFVYNIGNREYMLVVNAGNIEKDFGWLMEHKAGDVVIKNISEETAKLDVQGPYAEKTLQKLTSFDLSKLRRFYAAKIELGNIKTLISRTGYTAEDGFEIYFESSKAEGMWDRILEAGKGYGIKPIGLGARDTLRIEACYSLYGHELSDNSTPIEAGIEFVVKFNKHFIGYEALKRQKEKGTEKKLFCFEMIDKGIPRENYKIFGNGREIGFVTSGTYSPTFKKGVGMGYLREFKKIGDEICIGIRGKQYKARIAERPFYRYAGKKQKI
jgi:aminomethyltransferase